MISKRLSKKMSNSSVALEWSNVDYKLQDFIKNFNLPQVVKVKKDGSKPSIFKAGTEIVLHETKAVRKIEACIVSEGKKFVIPYDCPAKVYQLSKAEEYKTLGELRKAMPTCRYFFLTSKPDSPELGQLAPGEVLTIVFKKNVMGEDVFTCQRKKLGEIQIPAKAIGGFAPMATTQEKKISEFVRHYSTFPVGIGLSESTLANKSFKTINDLVSNAASGLIRLTKLYDDNTVTASSLGRKKMMSSIPQSQELTVTAPKALLYESPEHVKFCKELNDAVDHSLIERHLSLAISSNTDKQILQWSYGDESTYEEVVPLTSATRNGDAKRDRQSKIESPEIVKEKSKEKPKEKAKEKPKEKEKEKPKEKEKVKGKEKEKEKEKGKDKVKDNKQKMEKKTSNSKLPALKSKEAADLVEDDGGYLIPAELLKAEKNQNTDVKILEGDYEAAESVEKSTKSKATTLGRFMDKVKGKDKKKDRPGSEVLTMNVEEAKARSASLPAIGDRKTSATNSPKTKTWSSIDIDLKSDDDQADGPSTSPSEKDAKKRDKNIFSTAGKKAGAKLRNKLARSKVLDDQNTDIVCKDISISSAGPEDGEGDMYVAPVDDQLSGSPTSTVQDRPLPTIPPQEPRNSCATAIPYDDDELYDEINPVPEKQFKIPKDLSKLSVDGVCDVLRCLNMNEHVPKFRRDQIDGEIFKSLDDRLLGALGVGDPIQRLKLKKLLKGWRPKN